LGKGPPNKEEVRQSGLEQRTVTNNEEPKVVPLYGSRT